MASKTYATNMIEKFERLMADGRAQYHFLEYKTPMDKEYHPELDETPCRNDVLSSFIIRYSLFVICYLLFVICMVICGSKTD